jgi:hypothetical protein
MGKFGPASEHEVRDVLAKELATLQYGRFNDSVNAHRALGRSNPARYWLVYVGDYSLWVP